MDPVMKITMIQVVTAEVPNREVEVQMEPVQVPDPTPTMMAKTDLVSGLVWI